MVNFVFYIYRSHRELPVLTHSFPTRLSSDLKDGHAVLDGSLKGLLEHSQQEYIVSIHLVKLLSAVKTEITASPDAPWVPTVLAAVNRFLHEPLRRKHPLRTVRQAMDFVAAEG